MLDKDTFMGMVKAFRLLGMEDKEKEELELWAKLLMMSGINKEEFEAGYLNLALTCKTFWKNNNVPAMIIEKAGEYRADKKHKAFKERIEKESKALEEYKQKVLMEHKADPGYFVEQQEQLKKIYKVIGR